jgi:hypothetical protein
MDEMLIIFGNGAETTSASKTQLGDIQAVVCDDNQLTDNLVAIHPIVDAGYNIHFSSHGGIVDKPSTGHSIPIFRDGKKWLIDLEDLKDIKINQLNPIYCNSTSVTSKVLQLHDRMGHPSPEAMCTAITSGAWKNTKVSTDQVRRVMKQNPCLPCILAKKNKPKMDSSR